MRFLPVLMVALVLVACGDDDDDAPTAQSETTTTTAGAGCEIAPTPPTAADGTPAEVVAAVGDLQLAVVDRGASVDVVALFVTVGCAIEPVLLDGAPAMLAVGGSVTHGDGLRCDGDELTVLSATSDDGATYQATAISYEVDGTDLVEVDREASTIEAREDPDGLAPYYRLDC